VKQGKTKRGSFENGVTRRTGLLSVDFSHCKEVERKSTGESQCRRMRPTNSEGLCRCDRGRPEAERKVDSDLRGQATQTISTLLEHRSSNVGRSHHSARLTVTPHRTEELPLGLPPPSSVLERPPSFGGASLVLQSLPAHYAPLLLDLRLGQLPHAKPEEGVGRWPGRTRFGEVRLEQGPSFRLGGGSTSSDDLGPEKLAKLGVGVKVFEVDRKKSPSRERKEQGQRNGRSGSVDLRAERI
jgi:hypothetical protein